jgi:hypothetical protein
MRGLRAGLLLCLLLAALAARAGDGRIEINHQRALAGGVTPSDTAGYPVTLGRAGSYVLTSDLTAPAGTTAISVASSDVAIDLNGFALRGPYTCVPGACPTGSGNGIGIGVPGALLNTRVSGGTVRGFGGTCVLLGLGAVAERLQVEGCGTDGINSGAGSRVLANRIDRIRRHGINLGSAGASAQYGDNAVGDVALGDATGRSITGEGIPVSGNACDDGGCSRRGAQRFFLTTTTFAGNAALEACGAGFHMAEIYELLDVARLEYDRTRGSVTGDSGQGPPTNVAGWVRPGSTNDSCSDWTSNSATVFGLRATVLAAGSLDVAGTEISPFQVGTSGACNSPTRVWCIED